MKLKKKPLFASGLSALLCLFFAALFAIGEAVAMGLTEDLDSLNAGKRWSAAGEPYATIALHTDAASALTRNEVEHYAMSIDTGLLNASIASPENGSAWTYGYFAETTLAVTGPKATAQISTIAAGGSFFTFHPLEFVYGAPFTYDRTLPDGVVLDEDAAWRIFGAVDVVGMTLETGGRDLTVTGIVRKERNTEGYEKAYGDLPRMYMSYYGYEAITGEMSNITTYEVTLPNPVKSFAMNIFETAVRINEDSMTVRENSARYTFSSRFQRMKEMPYLGMRTDRIIYPYFENELQVTDYRTALWMQYQVAAAVLSLLCLLTAVICLFAGGFSVTGLLKSAFGNLQRKWEEHKRNSPSRKSRKKKTEHKNVTTDI